MKNFIQVSGCLAAFATLGFAAQNAGAQVVYNDTTTFQAQFATGTLEVGNEITLAGDIPRDVTGFSFEYYLPTAGTGNEMADVKFYANDSVMTFAGQPEPGTVLYDSTPFPITAASSATINFDQADLDGGVLVPGDFTWTVQFSNVGSETVGVDLYSPPTVGTAYNDMWQNSGSGWVLVTNSDVSLDIGALVTATPEPSTSALFGVGGLLFAGGLMIKRRLKAA